MVAWLTAMKTEEALSRIRDVVRHRKMTGFGMIAKLQLRAVFTILSCPGRFEFGVDESDAVPNNSRPWT